ncbi:MAG: hypothetical protein MZV63_03890 [Marinilabiliales bacterium]|nr:hypothetical protein [Marinilabiliales bacterium]
MRRWVHLLTHTLPPSSSEEFGTILRYSSHITFNSLAQYEKLCTCPQKRGRNISRRTADQSGVFRDSTWALQPVLTRLDGWASLPPNWQKGLPEGVEGLHFHVLFEI